jgi:hypothetical protein
MCRNIRTLFNFEPPATNDEIRASAVQFVRKLSGFTHPSKQNEAAFYHAVEEVTAAARKLLTSLETNAPPRDREVEKKKAQERARIRYGEIDARRERLKASAG